jgi:hypothetical protein
MSASVRRLYAVRETDPAPCAIPAPPAAARFVPLEDRLETTAVYGSGPICTENLRGFIRYDDARAASDRPAFVARTRGNASKPADMRSFTSREAAVEWLSRAIDGVIPRRPWKRRTLAAVALLACLAGPATAQIAVVGGPDDVTEAVGAAQRWVRPVADGEQALPLPYQPPRVERVLPMPAPIVHDSYTDGAIAGSWATAVFFLALWVLFHFPGWLGLLLAATRRPRAAP